ncbi:pickpocket protein 28-like [Musca vetustissima]|uniref:pickpocket protein 28-like n=1 Tax=Musca vetustissima TaxID=27455 RepID=UPI002AB6F6C9|nr:pickpocket protein 28-like [Musca vetustissima]
MLLWKNIKKIREFGQIYGTQSVREIFWQNTKEFCRQTTLHGMKYIVDPNLKPSERCFFGVSVVTVIFAAVYLIVHVYQKWANTPVIVGINPQSTAITDEPFPAVTICNLNQALNHTAEKFSRNSTDFTIVQLLCKREVNQTAIKSITNWNHVEQFIVNISQPCKDMLVECRFGGKYYNCSHLFYPLVTDEGLCCTFNMLHPMFMYVSHIPLSYPNVTPVQTPIDWYSEAGYSKNLPKNYYPKKVPGVGESLGLSVAIDVQEDKYYCSSSNSIGFKFALHSPNETPNVHDTGVFIEPGKETNIRIIPVKTESHKQLLAMSKRLRKCLFHDEGKLKFFAHYTQRNCEMECVALLSWKYCGCISFYMPKIYNNVTVCSINEAKCARAVRLGIYNSQTSCFDECLPGCFEIDYPINTFATKLAHTGLIFSNRNLANMKRSYVVKNLAIVHMFFSSNTFRSNLQTEFIDFSDFLSSVGGLMGLFLGFSFLSIAECIYYAVIHPCRTIGKYHKSLKSLKKVRKHSPKWIKKRATLKSRCKKLFTSSSNVEYRNEKIIKVPYAITYGFDVPVDDRIQLPFCQ